MITQLRFKNWRSLKDVTIDDLQPITVFIGANSSGKTNILDAMSFIRDTSQNSLVPIIQQLGYLRIQTTEIAKDENVELEFTYKIPKSSNPIREVLILKFDKRDVPFQYGTRLYEGETLLRESELMELPLPNEVSTPFWFVESPE